MVGVRCLARNCVHIRSHLKYMNWRGSVMPTQHCSHEPRFLISQLTLSSTILRRWFYKTDLLQKTPQIDKPATAKVAADVQVIGQDGQPVGSMQYHEAEQLAKNKQLKLVLIDPKSSAGATYQLMTGLQKIEAERQTRAKKRAEKSPGMKLLKIGATIAEHDLSGKISRILDWLEKGHPVRISINFTKSREGEEQVFSRIVAECKDIAVVQQAQRSKTELNFKLIQKIGSTTTDSKSSVGKPLKVEDLRKLRDSTETSELTENV